MRRGYRIFLRNGRARALLAEIKFKRPRPQRLVDFRFFPRVSTPANAILSIQQHRETPNSTLNRTRNNFVCRPYQGSAGAVERGRAVLENGRSV